MSRPPKKKTSKKKFFKEPLQSPKGMHDIVFPQTVYFSKLENICEDLADFFGYQKIEVPVLESKLLFEHGVGIGTDIVDKEMYTFQTKGGDWLSLRPEFTSGVIRAYIQNGMSNWPEPVKAFGIKQSFVEINSIGCSDCRQDYKKALKQYYHSKTRKLCPDCKMRFKNNILRLLECKNESCVNLRQGAPEILNYLCKDCSSHFRKVIEYLDIAGVTYSLNSFLVRGLDYYNRTVFELKPGTPELGADSPSLLGGGRFDYLTKLLAGPDTPACGFAIGVERMVELMADKNLEAEVDVYLCQIGFDLGRDSLKAQLTSADRLKAPLTLILGQDEAVHEKIILRDMKTGVQETLNLENIAEQVKKRLAKL